MALIFCMASPFIFLLLYIETYYKKMLLSIVIFKNKISLVNQGDFMKKVWHAVILNCKT